VRQERPSRYEGQTRNRRRDRAGQARLNDSIDKVAEPARSPQHADLGKRQSQTASKRHAQDNQSPRNHAKPVKQKDSIERHASGFLGTLPSGTFHAAGFGKSWLVMEMHQVRYFLAVAEELNFSRAARSCEVSQPALSRAIKLLEAELGGDLFRREGKNTHLSELGQMVRPHLEMVCSATADAKRVSRDLMQLKTVPLKLGIMSTIAPDEIVDLIAALKAQHPGLELRLCDASAAELRDRLLAGDLEVAIYALPGEQRDETHMMPLFSEQMVIAVNRSHRLSNARGFPVSEMNGG